MLCYVVLLYVIVCYSRSIVLYYVYTYCSLYNSHSSCCAIAPVLVLLNLSVLGDHASTSTDVLLSTLTLRVLKSLHQLFPLCLPKELLLSGPPSKTARAKLLADESSSMGSL